MINDAASQEPGERQTNIFSSFVACVHCGGTIHDIPCLSHFTLWPPASAAVWAAVGSGCSTDAPPVSVEPDVDLPDSPDLPAFFSLLLRLQSASANPRTTRTGSCFMAKTHRDYWKSNPLLFQKSGLSQQCTGT